MTIQHLLAGSILFFAPPRMGQAMELVGKKLELYGKVHVSFDYSDPDTAGEDSQSNISNNSTRIGFKGEHDVNPAMRLL